MENTPQALLPTYSSLADQLKPNVAQSVRIDPPRIVTLTGASDVVFDARPVDAAAQPGSPHANAGKFRDKRKVAKLLLHNLGTHQMYYGLNTNVTTEVFHDVFAGGSAVKDGLGSLVSLSQDQPDWVTVIGTAGEKVAVIITYPLETI